MDGRVHVHRERIAYPPDLDVLIKRVVVAILGQDSDVAFSVGDLVLTSGVVSDIRIRYVLNVPHHAVEHFGDGNVGLVVGWNNLASWTVLSLVIGYLPNVLGQLIYGQAWPCVDGLPLHRSTGRQHIGRPLPPIVRATSVELQVVNLVLARLRQRRYRHVQTASCGSQYA